MVKYTAENKLQAVECYLSGNGSSYDIAKSLGTDNKAILKWVKQFEHNGVDAFIKRCTTYTQEFKIDVLNFMTEYGTSLNETAAIFNIPAPSTITVWKKQLETHGIDAL
ncbi:transposase, partial [Lysinibacillus sphaericus]|uniref:transposase n=1 Tax=Lysinibacillus sphaericus TaxID=1421 RepID=UPI003F79D41B